MRRETLRRSVRLCIDRRECWAGEGHPMISFFKRCVVFACLQSLIICVSVFAFGG